MQFGQDTIAFNAYRSGQNTCTYSLSPSMVTVSYSGGYANVSVTSQAGRSWTAVSNVNWIRISSGASGTGNGTVRYYVYPNNTRKTWTGTLTIAGNTFTINQKTRNQGK